MIAEGFNPKRKATPRFFGKVIGKANPYRQSSYLLRY